MTGVRRPLAAVLVAITMLAVIVALAVLLGGRGPRAAGTGTVATPPATATPHHAAGQSPHDLNVVALGDSVTSGGACDCIAFPELYGRQLARERGVTVHVRNEGVGGLDSPGLLSSLDDPTSETARAVAAADIVVVTIGANDFGDHHDQITAGQCAGPEGIDCVTDELAALRANLHGILARTRALRGNRSTAVLVTGYWNVFEDGDVARSRFPDVGRTATIRLTFRANAVIKADADQSGATYVDLFDAFENRHGGPTPLLAPDGDHPNARGHALTARVLIAAGTSGLPAR
jgi:lysophospholipase L1-like esterase